MESKPMKILIIEDDVNDCNNFINCIKDEEADGRIKLHKSIIRDGYVHFEIEIFDFAKQRVEGIIESFIKGLYMLSDEYPQYVKFE